MHEIELLVKWYRIKRDFVSQTEKCFMICKKCLPGSICLLTNLPRQMKIYIYDKNIINTPRNTSCVHKFLGNFDLPFDARK